MIRKNFILLLIFSPTLLLSQITLNSHLVGASAGFSFLGSAPQIGINHEYLFSLQEIGIDEVGMMGVGGIFRYWGYSENFVNADWEYENVLFGLQTNYHFYMADERIDPWFGIIMAYNFSSSEVKVKTSGFNAGNNSNEGFWLGANAGLRFWLNSRAALNIRIGFGTLSYGAIDLGFDYEIN